MDHVLRSIYTIKLSLNNDFDLPACQENNYSNIQYTYTASLNKVYKFIVIQKDAMFNLQDQI